MGTGMSTGMANGTENGDEMENESGDEDADGDGDRADLGQESTQLAAMSLCWDDPFQDTSPAPPCPWGDPWTHPELQMQQPRPASHHKLSPGCMRGLHGVENINCGFLVHFLII